MLIFWIQFHVIRREGIKGLLKVVQIVVLPNFFYQHVILDLNIPPNLMCEYLVHQPLICGAYVLEFK